MRLSQLSIGSFARSFRNASEGSITVVFAVTLPVLMGMAGIAMDYARWNNAKAHLQSAADDAAIVSARELRLSNSTDASVAQVARNTGLASLTTQWANPLITTDVATDRSSVTVHFSDDVPTIFVKLLGVPFATIHATARARVLGGTPLCMLSLDPAASVGLSLSVNSSVTAGGCAVYSDSRSAAGFAVLDTSKLTAAMGCSAGGYVGTFLNFASAPQTDCPVMPDPMNGRPKPFVSGTCDYQGLVLVATARQLLPGTYCGGLTIGAGSRVALSPGTYVIKDGPLTVALGSSLTGVDVGFFLTGANSALAFLDGSTIDFSAPTSGPMAGVLVWEDAAATTSLTHLIYSANARNLLGTIYIPKGHLSIGSPNPVADKSAYTIILARYIELIASPNLVLNSNYNATLIPVPDGVGNKSGQVVLDR